MLVLRIMGRALLITVLLWWMFFVWLFARIGLRRVWHKLRGKTYRPLRNERLVRRMFEILGPTFIKLGQVVASSPGLFPKRYSDEFQKCLDRVPPFDLGQVKALIHHELGKPFDALFATFEDEPLGSASVAQVHGATLSDGSRVVVKCQRPGIQAMVEADVWWMRRGAWLCELLFKGARLANMSGVIDDFNRTIHEEIDFQREAANLREFNAIMREHDVDDVIAPTPVDHLVTPTVLVMSRFDGLKADDAEGIAASGMDASEYLRKGLKAWLLTVALHGFFHGDAHAGNLMLMPEAGPDGTPAVGFLDFGIIGRFDDSQRQQVMQYVLAFSAQDYEALADIMVEIGSVDTAKIDREKFVGDLQRTYAPLVEKKISDIKYEEILPEVTAIAYKWGIKLPSEFLLILKQLLFFDRYAKIAAPDLNVFSDFYLVDFMFTPRAMKAGLDFNLLMPLLQQIQQRNMDKQASGAPAS